MKKILVPTDFSENANNALRYAINIANYFDAEVHVLHVYESVALTGSYKDVQEYVKENAERDLSDNLRLFKDSLWGRTQLQGKAIDGNIRDVICSIAKNEKMDLVVMGTQGASGLKEVFIGSNTSAVMKRIETPLLAVPNRFKYRPIKDITFGVDSGIVADADLLTPLLEIAKAYKAKVKVMHLETEKMVVGYDPGIDISLEGVDHSFHKIMGSNDTNGVINLFVFEEKSDMLCLIRRKRSFWENLFHTSVTMKEVFDSPVPLLILHDKN